MAHIVGAECYKRSDGKADSQVKHKHHRDADHRRIEPHLAEDRGPEASRREGEHTCFVGDVTDVQRQPKKLEKYRSESQQITKRDAGAPGTNVAIDPIGKFLHSAGAYGQAERVL